MRNKLLSDYIQDKRGNCTTMPFLCVILGQGLGLDVTLAMAPLHVFVKFTDDECVTHNLEATSSAGRTRDQHYRDLLPVTDLSITNRVFLTPLTEEQSAPVIAAARNALGWFGGMGSLNDLAISSYNGHSVSSENETKRNETLATFCEKIYFLATKIDA